MFYGHEHGGTNPVLSECCWVQDHIAANENGRGTRDRRQGGRPGCSGVIQDNCDWCSLDKATVRPGRYRGYGCGTVQIGGQGRSMLHPFGKKSTSVRARRETGNTRTPCCSVPEIHSRGDLYYLVRRCCR